MIGDPASPPPQRFPHVYDLGAEWTALTGLPFVYAGVGRPAGRASPRRRRAPAARALRLGLAHRAEIARALGRAQRRASAALVRALPHRQHPLRARAPRSCPAPPRSSNAAHAAGLSDQEARRCACSRARPGQAPTPPRVRAESARALARQPALRRRRRARACRSTTAFACTTRRRCSSSGAAADARRRALHRDGVVTYIIDRNVNYTNVCVTRCKFCNFYRPPGDKPRATPSRARSSAQKLQETVDLGGVQILLQGGLNPELPLAYYEDLFRWMKANFPARHPRAFARGDPLHRRARGAVHPHGARAADRRRASIPSRAAAPRSSTTRSGSASRRSSARPTTWLEVMRQAHASACAPPRPWSSASAKRPEHAGRPPRAAARAAGRDRRLHRLHLLALPGRGHALQAARRHHGHALPAHLRAGAPLPRQLPQPAGVVADHGTGGRPGRAALRRQRLRLGDDRGERGLAGGRGLQAVGRRHRSATCATAGFTPRRRNMRYEWLAG